MSRSPHWDRRPPDKHPDIHAALVGSAETLSVSSKEFQVSMNDITRVAEACRTLHALFPTNLTH